MRIEHPDRSSDREPSTDGEVSAEPHPPLTMARPPGSWISPLMAGSSLLPNLL